MARSQLTREQVDEIVDFHSYVMISPIEAVFQTIDEELVWLRNVGLNPQGVSTMDFTTALINPIRSVAEPTPEPELLQEVYLVTKHNTTGKAQPHRIAPNVHDYQSVAIELIAQAQPGT